MATKASEIRTVNIHEAKTHLSRLVDEVEQGKPFIIAKAGKPKARVLPMDESLQKPVQRIGFLKGKIKVPDNFNTMFAGEIEKLFSGE